MKDKIIITVVTYNRRDTLKTCLHSLLGQSLLPDSIIIIDNGSTDNTTEMMKKEFFNNPLIKYINLGRNLGNAGGSYYGTRFAVEDGADWIWMMDDDCMPEFDCLEKLVKGVKSKKDIYSPIVLSLEDRSTVLWGIRVKKNTGTREVITLPFNGFFIHKESILSIGYPDKRFFIYGEDTEYNQRAKASGRKVMMVTESIMYHPHKNKISSSGIINMFSNKLWIYYKLRNAIIIYKKYKYVSINQVIMFVSAIFFFIITLNYKSAGLWFSGLLDGLRNRLYVRSL